MKKILKYSLSVLLAASMMLSSCEEDLPTMLEYPSYDFSGLDENGGAWKAILLDTPDQIVIDVPEDVTSTVYQNELSATKAAVSSLSISQKEAVKYWTNNPIVRWNEIALELAAKYNLIPGPNADGTYTLPSPANPAGPPPFPFAHPPYTSRALAYLSVSQFDALISVWHYKFQFDRPAPYEIDAAISSAYVENALPSYPSDGAAVAAASRDILSAMFPLERDFLAAKAEEHLSSLIWAGINVQSDIAAGSFIGSEVAKLALARASTDGMSKAQALKPVADSIKNSAFDRFGWKWENMEVPARPVGLTPLFSQVRMWNVPNLEATRPGPPPAPGSAEFEADAKELREISRNLTPEQRRIANFWNDGLGSYTPPGHWNRLAKEYMIKYKMNPLRSARTFAYLNMAIQDAGISCWDAKYFYHYPRPIATIDGFRTILGTPNFPSYTSGHSTFSAAAAEVMAYVFPPDAQKFRDWALEAAESRIYGGIHYRFDAEVGVQQGKDVAEYTIEVARNDGAN